MIKAWADAMGLLVPVGVKRSEWRWIGSPVPLFVYLSFLVYYPLEPEKPGLLYLLVMFIIFTLLIFVIVGLSIPLEEEKAEKLDSEPGWLSRFPAWERRAQQQQQGWSVEGQAWLAHKARAASQPAAWQRRRFWYRMAIASWLSLGTVGIFCWPYLFVAMLVGAGLLTLFVFYVKIFWVDAPAAGWFSHSPLVTFFSTCALLFFMVASTLVTGPTGVFSGEAEQLLSRLGAFSVSQASLLVLLLLWVFHVLGRVPYESHAA